MPVGSDATGICCLTFAQPVHRPFRWQLRRPSGASRAVLEHLVPTHKAARSCSCCVRARPRWQRGAFGLKRMPRSGFSYMPFDFKSQLCSVAGSDSWSSRAFFVFSLCSPPQERPAIRNKGLCVRLHFPSLFCIVCVKAEKASIRVIARNAQQVPCFSHLIQRTRFLNYTSICCATIQHMDDID